MRPWCSAVLVVVSFSTGACTGNPRGQDRSPGGTSSSSGASSLGEVASGAVSSSSAAPPACGHSLTSGCNDIAQTAGEYIQVNIAEDPPTFTGGTIVDGTYVITEERHYTGPGGDASSATTGKRTTVVIECGRYYARTDIGETVYRSAVSFTTEGNTWTVTTLCDFIFTTAQKYTADATSILFKDPNAPGTFKMVRQ